MSSSGGQGQGQGQGQPLSAPYPPQTWSLGGKTEEIPDVPVTAVFLALYVVGAVCHMAIFQKNLKRGHKFIMSVLMFGFCMCRIITCSLRIAAATKPTNIKLAIAAQIFVAAGVLIVYVVNLLFAQRLIRAQHPRWGWSKLFSIFFKINYFLILTALIMVITVTVQSFYTLSTNTRRIDRDIQLYVATYFSFVSFLPIPLVILGFVVPRKTRMEKFGSGRWRTKIFVLIASSFLVCLGACYRCATAYLPPVSNRQPLPDYYSKAAFYVFNFAIEIIVIYLYVFVRIDRRFHIPNGARGPGSYVVPVKTVEPKGIISKKYDSVHSGIDRPSTSVSATTGVYTEEETFDDSPLKLKTDMKRKVDLEAQYEPQSAISGTTAALSKDHLLLPESPQPAHFKSAKFDEVPPVPPLPPQAYNRDNAATPTPATIGIGAPAPVDSTNDKLDRVVDLLVTLDRRLSSLEETPRQASSYDLLDRLERRLARLEEDSTSRTPRPQQHPNLPMDLVERLERRLSRLEETEARGGRHHHNSGFDSLLALDRRLSRMEARSVSGLYSPPPPVSRVFSPEAELDQYPLPPAAVASERWDTAAAPHHNLSPQLNPYNLNPYAHHHNINARYADLTPGAATRAAPDLDREADDAVGIAMSEELPVPATADRHNASALSNYSRARSDSGSTSASATTAYQAYHPYRQGHSHAHMLGVGQGYGGGGGERGGQQGGGSGSQQTLLDAVRTELPGSPEPGEARFGDEGYRGR